MKYFKKIKADIKQLKGDIKEMKDDFLPATKQNVSGSVSNNLLKLGKQHYESGDCLAEKVIELCNDVIVIVFQNVSNSQLPKRTSVRFVSRQFTEDLLSMRNISYMLDVNKLGFPNL